MGKKGKLAVMKKKQVHAKRVSKNIIKVKQKIIKQAKKNSTSVTYKEYNNKSRKGLYAYVKFPKKRGSYYKVKDDIGKDDKVYKEIYETGGIKSNQGVTKKAIGIRRKSIKTIQKHPNIEEVLERGYAQTTVNNANKLTPYGIKIAHMNLLRNKDGKGDGHGIVRDKELMAILTLPENVEKWKHRIMYKIDLYDQNSEVIASIIPNTVKTLTQIHTEITGAIAVGQDFSTMYKELGDKTKKYGYTMKAGENKKGRITGIKVIMVFKK